jgi:mannitol-1-phosphate 5-dehydrogenase
VQQHITDLLYRFTNQALKDTCQRVGGDPARKLSAEDRLIGASKMALSQGSEPAYIAVGAAAGVHRYLKEAGVEQSMENARNVLTSVSELPGKDRLTDLILTYYQMLLDGCSLQDLLEKADCIKHSAMQGVI